MRKSNRRRLEVQKLQSVIKDRNIEISKRGREIAKLREELTKLQAQPQAGAA